MIWEILYSSPAYSVDLGVGVFFSSFLNLFIWETLAFRTFASVQLLYIYIPWLWVVGLFMLLNTSSVTWNNSNLFIHHILNLKIQNFSSWLLPSVSMVEIQKVGVWWTSQLFTIAFSDSSLLPALVYFQLLPLLEFFFPILSPSAGICFCDAPALPLCWLPLPSRLTSVCQRAVLQHRVLGSCATRCNGSRSRW